MIEVCPGLFVGDDSDCTFLNSVGPENGETWFVVQAAKEPWHRNALGYATKGAPKEDREYLYAVRPGRLIMNLVDAHEEKYIPYELIKVAVDFIGKELEAGSKVLVHCNKGESRAPAIAMLYMASKGLLPDNLNAAEPKFLDIYPDYRPGRGIDEFVFHNWHRFVLPKG
jgi:hypothetical protein